MQARKQASKVVPLSPVSASSQFRLSILFVGNDDRVKLLEFASHLRSVHSRWGNTYTKKHILEITEDPRHGFLFTAEKATNSIGNNRVAVSLHHYSLLNKSINGLLKNNIILWPVAGYIIVSFMSLLFL